MRQRSQYKSKRREKKRRKKRYGMRVDRSIKSVIVSAIQKRYGKKYRKTRGLEFGNQELARTEKDRRKKAGTTKKIRQPKKVGRQS